MTINFNYDRKFTENYVNAQIENHSDINLLNIGYKGFTFMKQLLQNYPEFFDKNGSVLFYIECGGKTIKPDFLYLIFENLVCNSNNALIKAKLNDIPLFTVTQDPYLQWARYLQASSIFPVFEPVMSTCNEVLKQFIDSGKHFQYKNLRLSISQIKPLCVTNIGENISELVLYIAYIYNFFINCNPFVFNEVLTGSSTQLFMEAINNHINVHFTKLIEEGTYTVKDSDTMSNSFKFNSLDQLYADVNNITHFNKDEIKSVITNILNYNRIREIRDSVSATLSAHEGECITNQNIVQFETCYEGFSKVVSNLIDIIINNNFFYKNILSNIPCFNQCNIDFYELNLLTSYALSGGKNKFVINEFEQYEGCCDPENVKQYPGIDEQVLVSGINKPTISGYKPFVSSNVFLEIIGGFVAQKFEEFQCDTLRNKPISVDEADLASSKIRIDKIINALYINGKYSLFSNSIKSVLDYLMKKQGMETQWKSILYLANLCSVIYDNKFGARILPAYILSFLPEYLTEYMNKNKSRSLSKFDYIVYFCLHHGNMNEKRVAKLSNMLYSIMFIQNKEYVEFVNKWASYITKILVSGAVIIQPYIKSVFDKIDALCIGGISLAAKSIDSNPLSRGYYYVVSTQGNCENLYSFYEFAKRITNNATFDLVKTAVMTKSDNSLKDAISQAGAAMFYGNTLPITLASYNIDSESGNYSVRGYDYYINLSTANNIPIYKLIGTYIFPEINANHAQMPTFYSRNIYIDKQAGRPLENKLEFGKMSFNCSTNDRGTDYCLPIYDFSSAFGNVSLSFIQPNGYKLLQIYTYNGELPQNNLFFVFTTNNNAFIESSTPIFDMYDTIGSQLINNSSTGIFNTNISTNMAADRRLNDVPPSYDRTVSTNRLMLNGVNKGPIPNVT